MEVRAQVTCDDGNGNDSLQRKQEPDLRRMQQREIIDLQYSCQRI